MNSTTNHPPTDYRLLFLIISLILSYFIIKDLTYTYGLNDPGYFYRSTGITQYGVSIFKPVIELFRLFFPGISFTVFLLLISWNTSTRKQILIRVFYWIGFYIITFYFCIFTFGLGVIICGGIGALLINNTISSKKIYPNWIMGLSGLALGLVGLTLVFNGDYTNGVSSLYHDDGEMYLMALIPWQVGIGLFLVFSNKLRYSTKRHSENALKLINRKSLALLFILILYTIIISIT